MELVTLTRGRQYRTSIRKPILSRDESIIELQQLIPIFEGDNATSWNDEGEEDCVRSIDWLSNIGRSVDPEIFLETSQRAVKLGQCVPKHESASIKTWNFKVQDGSDRIARRLTAEYEGLSSLLSTPALSTGFPTGPAPSYLLFRSGTHKSTLDRDFERWYFLQACMATCTKALNTGSTIHPPDASSMADDPQFKQ